MVGMMVVAGGISDSIRRTLTTSYATTLRRRDVAGDNEGLFAEISIIRNSTVIDKKLALYPIGPRTTTAAYRIEIQLLMLKVNIWGLPLCRCRWVPGGSGGGIVRVVVENFTHFSGLLSL